MGEKWTGFVGFGAKSTEILLVAGSTVPLMVDLLDVLLAAGDGWLSLPYFVRPSPLCKKDFFCDCGCEAPEAILSTL